MSEDTAKVSISVDIAPAAAFTLFTAEIDRWWRRGSKFRHAGAHRGFIRLEPEVGGRLFESFDGDGGPHVVEVGRVRIWHPPTLLVFAWRATNFAPHEETEVRVEFIASARGTLVTVTHSGLSGLRLDHPARHGNQGAAFNRMIGLWWGELMASFREHSSGNSS